VGVWDGWTFTLVGKYVRSAHHFKSFTPSLGKDYSHASANQEGKEKGRGENLTRKTGKGEGRY